jgi:hypothetical protein
MARWTDKVTQQLSGAKRWQFSVLPAVLHSENRAAWHKTRVRVQIEACNLHTYDIWIQATVDPKGLRA